MFTCRVWSLLILKSGFTHFGRNRGSESHNYTRDLVTSFMTVLTEQQKNAFFWYVCIKCAERNLIVV